MMEITIPYEVPSLNATAKMHWAKKSKINNQLVVLVRAMANGVITSPSALNKRTVHIIAYRNRLMSDPSDNLPGGAKGLRDAIKRAGLLIDDSETWATITYEQRPKREHPSNKACTVIVFDEEHVPTNTFKKQRALERNK